MATKTKSKSDIGRSSKRKGKIGELEIANLLKNLGLMPTVASSIKAVLEEMPPT